MNPMTEAHTLARAEMMLHGDFYGTYAACFADMLKSVYATRRYIAACDAKYGAGMRPGFQVVGENRWY